MKFYNWALLLLLLTSHFQTFTDAAVCKLSNTTLYSSFNDGDVILGAVVTLYSSPLPRRNVYTKTPVTSLCAGMTIRYYRHILAFYFAIDEINRNPSVLPNITLGYEMYDSCAYESKAIESTLKLLTGVQNAVLNYECTKRGILAGIIGNLQSSLTKSMAKITGTYLYPQVSYGAQDVDLSQKWIYPSLFRTVPNERSQYSGFIKLLKHFNWIWVGIIFTSDENSAQSSHDLKNELLQNGICIAFYQSLSSTVLITMQNIIKVIKDSSANVVFIFFNNEEFFNLVYTLQQISLPGKVWILPSTLALITMETTYFTAINGSLTFAIHKAEIPGLKEYIYNANPLTLPQDFFTSLVWRNSFLCLPANATTFRKELYVQANCTGKETLKTYEAIFDVNNFRLTYAVYRATYAFAYALHDWLYSRNKPLMDYKSYLRSNFKANTLNRYIKNVHFKTSSGENFNFVDREIPGQYDIMNWIITPNKTVQYTQVGSYMSSAPMEKQFYINSSLIQWNPLFTKVPRSVCSDSCLPGYRKAPRKSEQKCCYDCVLCSEGEISNTTDMDNCIKCHGHQWSNERRDMCIPRTIDFLSYEDDLGILLSFLAILLSAVTVAILAVFVRHKETPIVKANNRDLSYILLFSLALSFLCALLFIGRPQTMICYFRHAVFGIIFAIAVSAVLAKTITVVVAFNATKPGRESRKWMRARISLYLVCICAMGQVLICVIWFLSSPPFPDFDSSERSLKMTLQCNEGSAVAFYTLIGYMGILAVLSFIVAFLARKLPDTFNEASHITFSMLVFCSVWLSFFPAYLSTKGKYMVAVEVFAILASSGGLLCCIFLPKCYVIIIKPELNTKEHLIGKKVTRYNVE